MTLLSLSKKMSRHSTCQCQAIVCSTLRVPLWVLKWTIQSEKSTVTHFPKSKYARVKTESPNRVRMRASCRAFARFAWRRLAKILCCQLCCCPLVFWRTAVYFRFNIYIWKLNVLQSCLINGNQSPEKNNWNSFGRLLFKVKKSKLFFLVLGGVNGIIFINIQLECKCTFTKKYLSKYHQ